MKNCIFLLFTAIILITACKTETAKNDRKSINYTDSEKVQIAQLVASYCEGYNYVLEYSEGKAVVIRNDSVGFIDLKGNLTMLSEINILYGFMDGLSPAVTRDSVPCYVNSMGKIVQKFPNYKEVHHFDKSDYAVFFDKNNKFGLLDKSFKEIIPAKYNHTSFYNNGLFIVELEDKWGAVDKDDKVMVPFVYESLQFLDDSGYLQANKKSGEGFIDKTGKELIPFIYYKLSNFHENLAIFSNKQEAGKYGVINRKGESVVPPQFNSIQDFSNDMAVVSKLEGEVLELGYIDSTGKEVIPTQYETARDFTKEGYALVGNSGVLFFIDKKGQKVTFPKLDELKNYSLTEFSKGFAKVTLEDGSTVFLDRLGNILKPSDLLILRSQFFK